MSKVQTDGIDELLAKLTDLSNSTEEIVDEMLFETGVIYKDAWEQEIEAAGLVDTGTLKSSMAARNKVSKDGTYKYVDVYPKGKHPNAKDKNGKPLNNAAIAFILNYGTSKREGKRFVTKAEEKGTPKAIDKINEIWDKFLKEKGLI